MHTKGPWQYDAYDAVIKSPTGITICRLTDLSGQTYARPLTAKKDGQLLAAAPDLLTACKAALLWLENVECDYSNGIQHGGYDEGAVYGERGHRELTKQLHDVIAAARGER